MPMDTKDPPQALPSPPVNPPLAGPPQLKRGRPRRTLSQEQREEIVELHPFYGSRKIAERTNLTRQIVERVLRERGLLPTLHTPLLAHSKLAPFYEPIAERVQKDLTATRILREIAAMGYSGGRTILAEHLRKLRAEMTVLPRKPTTKRRFETGPAVEMQIDWSPYEILIAGRSVKVHVLGCLLCYSRKLFLHFYRDERQSTLLEGLASAFEYFDGVAHRLVLDNMSTAVLGRIGSGRKPLWHDRFSDFVRHYGMDAFACKVRDPDRKGKKEKSFRLVWDDFVKGTEFDSWDDLHARCRRWLDESPRLGNLRVHGTTRRVPNEVWDSEEHALLIRLPRDRFPVHESAPRIVDRDSTLSIHGTRYTVPAALAGRSVAVRLFAEHFDVLDPHGGVAFSRIYVPDEQKGRLVIDETHYANLPRRGPGRGLVDGGDRLDEAFLRRFPDLAPLVDGLRCRMKTLAPIHIRALLRLCDRFGEDAFRVAATRAQHFRRFDATAVERILDQQAEPLPDIDAVSPLWGCGPTILGEIEAPSLDAFGDLDAQPGHQDASHGNATLAVALPEEDNHGS
jgi:transposase